ncbi:hypothetical protein MR818_11880 [bacterium]|nr:hypothetical protein [bacterium]
MVSILFIICSLLFIGSLSVIVSSKTENIVEAVIVATAYLFCIVGIIGAIYEVTHLPVYLPSICVGVGIVDIFFIAFIAVRRKQGYTVYQKEKNDYRYLLLVCVLIGFVLFMCFYHFGINLKLTYGDVDAVRYFTMAMDIVKTHTISDEFVTPLWISIFIQLIQPIQPEVFLYRGMVLGNICMQTLITLFFFILVNKVNQHRNVINTIITILFWCGYQLYILSYGTFLHWEDGILLIMFIIYHIMVIWEKKDNFKYGVISCLAGTLTLALCYPFFGIILIALVLPEVVVWMLKDKNRKMIPKMEKIALLILFVIGAVIGIVFMKERIPNVEALLHNFSTEGLAYKEPFMDFIFFIPIVILYFIFMIKNRYDDNIPRTIFRMNISVLVFMVCWFEFYAMGYLSNYYLYRNYYVVWVMAWLVVAQTIGILLERKQALLVGTYAVLYGLCIAISVIGLDEKIYKQNPDLYLDNPSSRTLTPLYSFNMSNWIEGGRNIISADMYDIYQYRIEYLKDEYVPMISSQWKTLEHQWYSGICYLTSEEDTPIIEQLSFIHITEWLDDAQINYILIDKSDQTLQNYSMFMNEYWNVEVENDAAIIYKRPKNGWSDIRNAFSKSTRKSVELENYIRQNYGYNGAMLICEATYNGRGDVNEYRAYIGENSIDYVGKFSPESFVESTYVLNNDEVKYLTVYKDSMLYLYNQEYFFSQTVLYESDLAIVVTYSGDGWMPNQ